MSFKMTRWRGIPMLAWIALIAALTGAGVLIEGISPRAAWAQVEVFVTNFLGDSVTSYSRTSATAIVAPLRIISGPATELADPAGLAVDTVNNEILVANISSITVYSLTASGNAAPLRTISGATTELAQPIGLAVDTVNNEILVANVELHHGLQPDRGSLPGQQCERQAAPNHQRTEDEVAEPRRPCGGHGQQRDPGCEHQLLSRTPRTSRSITVYSRSGELRR